MRSGAALPARPLPCEHPRIARLLRLAAAAALVTTTVLVYAPALPGELQFDDRILVKDPALVALESYGDPATWFGRTYGSRPLTHLTFALNHAASGLSPVPLHAVNLGLHLLATALVFALVRITLRRTDAVHPGAAALAVAAVFALHPVQTQAVAYVWQRAEVLAATLMLASLVLLLEADARPPGRAWRWRAGGACTFLLALAAKPTAAVLPAAWLLHAAWFPAPDEADVAPWRRVLRRLPLAVPMAGVAGAVALAGIFASRGQLDAGLDIAWLDPLRYGLTQLRVVPRYLGLLLWPAGQNVDWDVRASRGILDPPTTLAGGIAIALVVAAAFAVERRTRAPGSARAAAARLASFGALWFLLVLLPSSSAIPLADLLVEHRLYLASLGVFLPAGAAAVAAVAGAPRGARIAAVAAGAAVLVALSAATFTRSRLWASELALWSDAATKAPRKARVHLNLGHALVDDGRLREALAEYALALRHAGDHSVSALDVTVDMANVHLDLGEIPEAAGLLERAVSAGARAPDVRHNLAIAWLRLGRLDDAQRVIVELLASHPAFARGHNALGLLHERRGDAVAARDAFAAAERLAPGDAAVLRNLARAEARLGERR